MTYLDSYGVMFASPDGYQVCAGSAGNVKNATELIFTKRQWEALDPSSILAAVHDGVLHFWFTGTTPDAGYAYDAKQSGFGLMSLAYHAIAAHVNPITDQLYVVLDVNSEPTDGALPLASSAVVLPTGPQVCIGGIGTWTARTIPAGTWDSVGAGNGVLLVGGLIGSTPTIQRSVNGGVTWAAAATPPAFTATFNIYSISYSPSLNRFVAVGANATVFAYSTDGDTWVTAALVTIGVFERVKWLPQAGVFIALRSGPSCLRSADGITFTDQTMPGTFGWNDVAEGGGVLIAIAGGSTNTARSLNGGVTWAAGTALPGSLGLNFISIAYGAGVFIAVSADNNTQVAISTDLGVTWGLVTVGTLQGWTTVIYAQGIFTLTSQSTTQSRCSVDGSTWTAGGALPSSGFWKNTSFDSGTGVYVTAVYSTPGETRVATSGCAALSGGAGSNIYQFDGDPTNKMAYRWRGKLNLVPYSMTYHFARVDANDFTNVIARFISDKVQFHQRVITSNLPFRIPESTSGDSFEVELIGTSSVRSIQVATSVDEMT
jgi:hypothetical protein